ncbi:type II toxin-antitoxin system VapC family toxin [Paractinoplanes rishiriensis]|uniref:Ribonuclease VapC n=1 Tax=Paractinoplanes rishiriensis TaxID=1050105 RepID=A0A919MYF9_9ACTN|nr:type II toxin-antitoxin system VapC family toxin [Actinoplanes rishiriensis]GIE96980.1 ribonuclease VapC [Actinoplanes rishiriensis]
MGFLLDTNVISEPRKASPDPRVLAWLRRQSDAGAEMYLSSLVVGEVRKGIEQVRPRAPRQAEALEAWLAGLIGVYGDRILPVSAAVADEWGRLTAAARPPTIDGLIAATAKVHRLTLATRNIADVAGTGVPVVNPFES